MADLQLARQAMLPTLHAGMTRVSGCINSGASTRARNSISRAEVQRSKCIYSYISFRLFRIHQRTFPVQICVLILLLYSITMARSNPIKRRFRFPNTEGIMGFLPDGVRNHIVATIAELAGTFLFLFFALSIAQVANTPAPKAGSLPSTSNLLFIALGFGCSVAVNVWIFYRVSGGMFNPAV
jgi:hypothetical protein